MKNTDKNFEIKNNIEFDTYSEIEKKVEDLNSWMQYYIDPSLTKKLYKKLKKLEEEIYQLRENYQKSKLIALNKKSIKIVIKDK